MPAKQAATLLRCADKQLWRRIDHCVSQARALDDMSAVQIVGIDETSLRRGQSDISVVHDLDTERLRFATEGRDHQTVVDWFHVVAMATRRWTRAARGFRTAKNFIGIAYLRKSKLEPLPAHPFAAAVHR